MNLVPSKLGAEPKKLAALGGLVVLMLGVWWWNRSPSSTPVATPGPVSRPKEIPEIPGALPVRDISRPGAPVSGPRVARRNAGAGRSIDDFRPTLKLKEGTDLSRIDPSIRQELLARLREVPMSGGARSLFEFGQAPAPPPPPPPKVTIKVGPPVPPPEPPKQVAIATAPPPPPPIPLKFYGYSGTVRSTGVRRAFFLDGEDIFVAGENELIRNRYKIIRIGVNSAVVEDTTNKNQQTLPLVEELAG